MDLSKPRGWRDWEKVLMRWRAMDRSGLSLHALSTIVEREPFALLREMEGHEYVEASYCGTIRGPVFSIHTSHDDCWVPTKDEPLKVMLYSNTNDPYGDDDGGVAWKSTLMLLARYAWPKYKGVRNDVCITNTGLERSEVNALKKMLVPRAFPWCYEKDVIFTERNYNW